MDEKQVNALFEQSIALLQHGKAQEALKLLGKLDQAIPSNPGILFFTATAHSIAGNKHKAIQTYERVLRLNPEFIEAYNNVALDLAYLGEHQKAIKFLDRALTIRPDFIEAIVNKGCCLNALGEHQSACQAFETALRLSPNDAMALANISVALIHLGAYQRAREFTEHLLRLSPNDYKGHANLGKISLKLEETENALSHFIKANELNPNDLDTISDLGSAYAALGQNELALSTLKKALEINPEHGASHVELGLIYHDLRNFDQAIYHFSTPIQDKYRLTLREYNRALSHLHSGNLQQGWSDYEWRWKEANLPIAYLDTQKALWNGAITDAPVLIWHEQGIGDQILFGTLLPEVLKRAPNLLVRLDGRLVPLFQRSMPSVRFIADSAPISETAFKYHLPMADLGGLFRGSIQDFDLQPSSYLRPNPDITTSLKTSLSADIMTVGLSWLTKGQRSKERKLPIGAIVSAIQKSLAAHFIDLQYSDTTEARAQVLERQGVTIQRLDAIDNFNDLDGLASLISECDFVVTCSNSTAHIAGALGKETYLLVPFGRGRHWYWSHTKDDGKSMWYPSVRVIPQTKPGSWEDPVNTLICDLKTRGY